MTFHASDRNNAMTRAKPLLPDTTPPQDGSNVIQWLIENISWCAAGQ